MKRQPVWLIEWVDASRLSDGWMDWSAIPDLYQHKCVSVGFLAGENEFGKILVPTIGDHEHPDKQAYLRRDDDPEVGDTFRAPT